MKLRQALSLARERLAGAAEVDNPSLECEVLLRHVLQIDRVGLHLRLDEQLSSKDEATFRQFVQRRLDGEPVAYITGKREFYGLEFSVDRRVLIPRPESELLVDEAIKFSKNNSILTAADIGTGSGAIAVSLAKNIPGITVYAVDNSPAALEVAAENVRKHGLADRIKLRQGSLLEPLPHPVDLIIATLPYIRSGDLSSLTFARFEPVSALDGGHNGLDKIFEFSRRLVSKIRRGGCVLIEIGDGQAKAVSEYILTRYPSITLTVLPDLSGIDRVVRINWDTPLR